jgi:hypothetical protein
MALAGGGSTSNGRPYTLIVPNGGSGSGETGVETLPLHSEFSGITFTVAASAIRLSVSALTALRAQKLNDGDMWLLADDGTATSEVRRIMSAEIVDGTPDTYFVTVDEPFTVAPGAYEFKYVDPSDAQRNNTVIADLSNVYIDGVDTIPAGASQTFEPDMPFKPIVLYSDTDYKVSNGFFFDSLGGGATDPLVYRALLTQTSTNPPVGTVLENTLGEVPTYAYVAAGQYTIDTVADLFVSGKTMVFLTAGGFDETRQYIFNYRIKNTKQITFTIYDNGTSTDDVLIDASVQILIYP